jgi:PEP-CTERM motif
MTLCHRLMMAMTVLVLSMPAAQADLLSGTVAYDLQTHLYTYSYKVDQGAGFLASQLSIMVAPPASNTNAIPQPVATTSPNGWYFGASEVNFTFTAHGVYWSWSGNQTLRGTPISGFSFTTPAAPAVLSPGTNNYVYVYGPVRGGLGTVTPDYLVDHMGQVVAPGLDTARPAAQTPEPSTLLLGGLGCLILPFVRRQRHFPGMSVDC